ncbi:HAD hydrolase-like protein [Candidatus Saccharibacteria bacterium]|nr:HAD hydrolase-like protein [Candidatus Saccharibacteria bacterium]
MARTWYNKELLDEELHHHWGKPLHEMVCLLYETDDVELALARNRLVRGDFPKVLFDETIGVLERLRARDKMVGIVTATSQNSIGYDMGTLGVPSALFDYVQTANDTDYHKPDPRVFEPTLEWLSRFAIRPHEVVYVGDGLHDMESASGAGLRFIGVETGLVSSEDFRRRGAVAIGSLTELVAV